MGYVYICIARHINQSGYVLYQIILSDEQSCMELHKKSFKMARLLELSDIIPFS